MLLGSFSYICPHVQSEIGSVEYRPRSGLLGISVYISSTLLAIARLFSRVVLALYPLTGHVLWVRIFYCPHQTLVWLITREINFLFIDLWMFGFPPLCSCNSPFSSHWSSIPLSWSSLKKAVFARESHYSFSPPCCKCYVPLWLAGSMPLLWRKWQEMIWMKEGSYEFPTTSQNSYFQNLHL